MPLVSLQTNLTLGSTSIWKDFTKILDLKFGRFRKYFGTVCYFVLCNPGRRALLKV